MVWTLGGSILLTTNWQYTDPIPAGSFFRLRHTQAPNDGLFLIGQGEVDVNGNLFVIDTQLLEVDKSIVDVLRFSSPGCFSERRIAIRKVLKQPTLQQELRRLFLPGYLQPTEEEIRIVSRSNWSVEIETSDFLEPPTTVDLSPIQIKLNTISLKIDSLQQSNQGTTGSTTNVDSYFSNVVLLMHFDGANNSVAFTDIKNNQITVNGDTKIDTTESKFGGSSAYFDGSGDYLAIGSNDLNLESSDFTAELFINFSSLVGDRGLFSKFETNGGFNGYIFRWNGTELRFSAGHGTELSAANFAWNPSINTWYHLAVVRNSTTITIFADGISLGTLNLSSNIINSVVSPFVIGFAQTVSASDFNGYIDDLRITKGIARYTANFNPPTLAFSNN